MSFIKSDWDFLEGKSPLKMLGLPRFPELDWVSYFVSTGNTVSRKVEALIFQGKSLLPEAVFYLY